MATKTHVYPRVDVSTKALTHSSVGAAAEDTTVLFVPLCTKKGPSAVVTPVHSLSEFITTFGSLDYDINGQTALNVYNWLSNGGTVYAWRLDNTTAKQATSSMSVLEYTPTTNDVKATENTYVEATFVAKDTILSSNKAYLKYDENTKSFDLYTPTTNDVKATENTYVEATFVAKDTILSSKKAYLVAKDTKLKAKYKGSYYNNLEITLLKATNTTFSISISCIDSVRTVVEKYSNRTLDNYKKALTASEYIDASNSEIDELINAMKQYDSLVIRFNNGVDAYDNNITQESLLKTFWGVTSDGTITYTTVDSTELSKTPCIKALGNPLETPIDLIMDAGYSKLVKYGMMSFINNSSNFTGDPQRTDIIGIFDDCALTSYLTDPTEITSYTSESFATNIAIYHDYYTINDATFTDRNMYVGLTYYLSKLIPYNDLQYGIQSPTAGLRRAVLDDVLAIHSNPSPDDKDDLFEKRINYVEKSSRECAIMSQRTHDGSTSSSYTALSFLNNARVLEKMKKEIEKLARNYLFEFNDSATLSQMSNVLNKYMNQWISNRTLSEATVIVSKNDYSDEAVDVTMNVKFNGTIEVISVDITIE